MRYWSFPTGVELLLVLAVLAVVRVAMRGTRLPVPPSLVAGGAVLALGLSGLVPYDPHSMEILVYHGLALTFLSFGMQRPERRGGSPEVWSMSFAMALTNLGQGALGLIFVLAWSAFADPLHPGFGWLLPLGFAQGPGQAMSVGDAMSHKGLVHGGQAGLAFAVVGYVWAVVVSIPLIALARARGWVRPRTHAAKASAHAVGTADLGMHVAVVGLLYGGTYLALQGLDAVAPEGQRPMVWGFHYLVALGFGLSIGRTSAGTRLGLGNDDLSGIAALCVEVTTVAALAALRVDVLGALWVPIAVLTTLGGLATLLFTLWQARRAYRGERFEHALVFFGALTGTLPTGLALLTVLDPELRGRAGQNQVFASATAIPLGMPLLLVFFPIPLDGWPDTYPRTTLIALAVLLAYASALFAAWWRWGALSNAPTWEDAPDWEASGEGVE
ncbi:MAG: hypothetical protein EP330_27970 [Deltaproteobacteria bacterium]|nr:MAG: hypothetical protein EP330_27970 [Deltaproteobacteria bacterium]